MLSRLITLSPTRSNLLMVHLLPAKSRAGAPRRIPRPHYLSSFFGTAAARQRLDPLYLFARLLVKGGVAEVDVAVQARVRVILFFGGWVRWVRYSHGRQHLQCVGRASGRLGPPRGLLYVLNSLIISWT